MNEEIKEFNNIIKKDSNVIAVYEYGSSVYKTTRIDSDYDVIMVVQNKNDMNYENFNNIIDINIFEKNEFIELIVKHEITPLECLWLDKIHVLKETEKWDFNLDVTKLRTAISAKSSNSWVKAKKKFLVEKDFNPYIGKKSAWHAIRILDFGQQIAETGKIYNYSNVNKLLQEIMECNSWEEIDSNFRGVYNETSTRFKLVAPKTENINPAKNKI